jgi:hypothetical protein
MWFEPGAVKFRGTWPSPGRRYYLVHRAREISFEVIRISVPWEGIGIFLHDESHALVAYRPWWARAAIVREFEEHGFVPVERRVWFETALPPPELLALSEDGPRD